jgi:aspartyl-tRNA(Asn)/glutamyl-tRNA(Gln) amidotransferase subunit A
MSTDTITTLAPRVATGEVKSERLVEDALAVITALQPRLNAFITVTGDEALARARAVDKEIAAGRYLGPLHGIPLSLTDLVDMSGVPTTAASRVRDGHVAKRDAPVVRHLRAAGAVFVGKTNLHEFAFGTTNEDSGWGPARNPIDPSRSPGGSSGGSAIAVKTGMSIASVGTDTGGSVRIPAAACGIVGLKPGWGEIPADGVVPLSRQLDHVGPLARSVDDAQLLYEIMRGASPAAAHDARDSINGLRLAVLEGYFAERVSPEIEDGIRIACEMLAKASATLTQTTLPHAADIAPVYLHLVLADAAAYHAVSLQQRPHAYTENVRIRLEMGRHILGEDYARALRGRAVITREIDQALQNVDALILPALAIEAPPLGATTVAVKGGQEPVRNVMLRCTQPFNVSGHPAITVPCGVSPAGLPIGLQIVGHRGRTPQLLRVARVIERTLQRHG